MKPFRFLHTADIHLGTPFRGLDRRLPDEWAARLKQASYGVFDRIVKLALEQQVQFVTIAGDVLDSGQVPMSVYFELRRGFEALQREGISVFLSHGNHDPLEHYQTFSWPDNVYVFPAVPVVLPDDYQVPFQVIPLSDGGRVQISGFSYRNAELFQSLASRFVRMPDVDYAIGLYHGVVGAALGHENYAATSTTDLAKQKFDFWGLGHIHQPQVLQEDGPVIVYPGNPQGRHVRERGARGVYIVDVAESGQSKLHFVPTDVVRFTELTLDLTDDDDVASVRERMRDAVIQVMQQADGQSLVVRYSLFGRTLLHDTLSKQDVAFAEALQEEFTYLGWPVCIESVHINTEPPLDITALYHSRTYVGEVLRLSDGLRGDIQSVRALLRTLLKDLYHPGTGLSVDDWSDDDILALLSDAEKRILTHVESAVDAE